MAKAATTRATKAPKAAKAPAAKAEAPAAAKASAPGTATIKFDKAHHGGTVRGGVNGQRFEYPVDKEVTVSAEQLEALNNSGAKFDTISPLAGEGADEGSSAPSTVTHTALRVEVPTQPKLDEDGNPVPVPELGQDDDKTFLANAQRVNTGEGEPSEAEKAAAAKDKQDAATA